MFLGMVMLQNPAVPDGPVIDREIVKLVAVKLTVVFENCEEVTFPWTGNEITVPLAIVAVNVDRKFSAQLKVIVWSEVTFVKV